MTSEEQKKARGWAVFFWNGLSDDERWGVGDQLVLGAFDWSDWADVAGEPPKGGLDELDKLRIGWEDSR